VLTGYFGRRKTRLFTSLERRLAKRSDALVAVSEQVRDDLVRLGVAPTERIEVIRLGIDLERRTRTTPLQRERIRAELGVDEEGCLALWVGRMTEIKRVDLLLEALARTNAAVTLALLGDGPLRESLEERARELGVLERCRFVGFREDVGPYLAGADLVVLTSANEGTPVSLIEALAAGRPVVSTDVGGVRDVVADGETGLLVPSGDAKAVAAAIDRLASDPTLRAAMGERGREDVVARYSVARLLDDVDALYRRLLAAKGRSGPPAAE
jgi:glycosyltransferase involved in cell wall biosynthesis